MPKIPIYQRHVSLPAKSGMVQRDSRAEVKYYGAVSKAGEAISDFATKMYEAKQVTELSNAQLDSLKQLTEYENGLRDRQDFDNFEPEYEKKVKEIRNYYQKNLMDNKVKQAFASDFERTALRTGVSIRSIANKKRIDHGSASYFNNMTTLKGMLPGADETLKQEIHTKTKIQTSGAVAAGYLTEEQGAERLQKFMKAADTVQAMADLRNDPDNFDSGQYNYIDPKTKILLEDQAIRKSEQIKKDRITQQEKADKTAEKEHKARLENNDFGLWQKQHAGALTESELEDMADNRLINKQTYLNIKNQRRQAASGQLTHDDPIVVGELSVAVVRGIDINKPLLEALEKNQIKTETYIALKKGSASKEYKDGLGLITNALKPSAADKWSPDKHLRYQEAIDTYHQKLQVGLDPVDTGRSISKSYTSDKRRSIDGFPRPAYLEGDKNSRVDLEAATDRTVKAFLSEEISKAEYNRQINIISELQELVQSIEGIPEDIKDEVKKRTGK